MTVLSPPLRFLLFPTNGIVREHVRAELFGRALSQRLGRPVLVELARSYEAVEQELVAGRVDMAWATSEQCTRFEPQSHAVLRVIRSGRPYYHAALICRADAPLSLDRLKGTRAAWLDPLSTGGYLLAMRYLEEQGLRPAELFSAQRFYGSYRKALVAVLSGEADFTSQFTTHTDEHAIRARLADRLGADERRLMPFAVTGPAPADGIILTSRLTKAEAEALISAFTSLSHDGSGMEPLLGMFDIEGFALPPGFQSQAAPPQPVRRSEHVAMELDAQGQCQYLSSPTGTAFGREIRKRQGSTLAELLPTEASDAVESLVRATRHSGVSGRLQCHLDVNGEARLFLAEATVSSLHAEKEPPTTTLVVRDITETHALENELYQLASFPLLHPEPMLELELPGTLRYANPAAHTAFPDLMVLGPHHPLVEAVVEHARHGGRDGVPLLLPLAGRYWELVLSSLSDHESLRVFAKDVTARKQIEARLLHADRMAALGSLASRVGHEMNNPLAFLMANLSFAREEIGRLKEALRSGQERARVEDLDEVLDALGESLEGAERLKTIVQDLRMLAREPPTHRARVDLHPVLEDTLKLVRNELRHRARLEKDFQPVPPVEADEARLGQVFLNLMLNAVQAMSEQDAARNVLRVTTRTGQAGEVVVEVQDTGAGMPPEVLSRLFEPFFTTRSNSVGMGLSVSHAIVTSLGGQLRAESEPGVGTLFTIVLPPA